MRYRGVDGDQQIKLFQQRCGIAKIFNMGGQVDDQRMGGPIPFLKAIPLDSRQGEQRLPQGQWAGTCVIEQFIVGGRIDQADFFVGLVFYVRRQQWQPFVGVTRRDRQIRRMVGDAIKRSVKEVGQAHQGDKPVAGLQFFVVGRGKLEDMVYTVQR